MVIVVNGIWWRLITKLTLELILLKEWNEETGYSGYRMYFFLFQYSIHHIQNSKGYAYTYK